MDAAFVHLVSQSDLRFRALWYGRTQCRAPRSYGRLMADAVVLQASRRYCNRGQLAARTTFSGTQSLAWPGWQRLDSIRAKHWSAFPACHIMPLAWEMTRQPHSCGAMYTKWPKFKHTLFTACQSNAAQMGRSRLACWVTSYIKARTGLTHGRSMGASDRFGPGRVHPMRAHYGRPLADADSSNERNRQLDRQDTVMEQMTCCNNTAKPWNSRLQCRNNTAKQQQGKALEQQGKVLEQQITMLQRQDKSWSDRTLQRQDTVMERQDKALEQQGKALESASLGILELLKRSA